jgi:hypothetical protein
MEEPDSDREADDEPEEAINRRLDRVVDLLATYLP